MSLKQRIQDGLDGKFQGLSNGFNRINNYIFGIQKSCYYLLGGGSGVGKSTLCDYMLLNAIQDAKKKGIKLTVFYYSYEIDKMSKQCNWLSASIYQKYGIEISPEKIKGLGTFRLTAEEQKIVDSEIPEIEELFNTINFRFHSTNPTGIFHELWQYGIHNGELLKEDYTDKEGETKQRTIGYKPNDPEEYKIVVLDHFYNLQKERGFQTKEVIDKYSEYCVQLRNLFGYTFFNVQQFNQGLSSIDRMKYKGADLSPQQSDFRDTTNPYTDCDVAIGMMSPFKLGMDENLGYKLNTLRESFIHLKIIKNRLSRDNIGIGLYFNPKAGSFSELPLPNKIDYNKYK